ncbi:SgcJ/EcaC family oxidoreductase [Lysobacter soli]|uniref:SgcJ/EcaC family oxidoreductase n=1 Tax=Lysobacter soli TaxID=453783 RepID=UPI0037C776C2
MHVPSLILAAAAALALFFPAQPVPPPSALAENRALAASFSSMWNRHTMLEMRRIVTSDVDWVNVDAGWGRGAQQIVAGHERVHLTKFKNSVMTIEQVDVAMLRPDIALVHVRWSLRGDTNEDGSPRAPRSGLFTWVTIKDPEGWKIRASHNTNRQTVK